MNLDQRKFLLSAAAFTIFLFSLLSFHSSFAENHGGGDNAFIENRGQLKATDGEDCNSVLYYSHQKDASVYVQKDKLSFVFNQFEKNRTGDGDGTGMPAPGGSWKMHRVDLTWINANADAEFIPSEIHSATRNYFTTSSGDELQNLPEWQKLTLFSIYESIDLQLYYNNGHLKYDFIIHPGGNPSDISLQFSGADKMMPQADGSLTFKTSLGEFTEGVPLSYQGKSSIPCRYQIGNEIVRFTVGEYDKDQILVIDPLREWATYFGGSDYEFINKSATGPSGDLYICGMTMSVDFPVTAGAFQGSISPGGWEEIFFSRIGQNGVPVWTTYYGGSLSDEASDITVDASEGVHIVGHSNSSDFPFTWGGYTSGRDIIVLHFDSSGARISATMFGGSSDDYGFGIAVKPGGGRYLVGQTFSTNFPTSWGCFQAAKSVTSDIFVTQLNPGGSLAWSTFLGGNALDIGYDIISDSAGFAVLSGYSYSTDFPVSAGCFQDSLAGKNDNIIARFDPTGALDWATYFGGSQYDYGWGIAVDDSNRIYTSGETSSSDLPVTAGTLNGALDGANDMFVTRFSETGNLDWAGYWGGNGKDAAYELKWDNMRYIHLTGRTNSTNLPVTADAIQTSLAGDYDVPLLSLNPQGQVVYAGYYGGTDYDASYAIATDGFGAVYLAGETGSLDLPVDSTAFQPSANLNWDGWIARLDFCEGLNHTFSASDEICNGSNGSVDLDILGGNSPVQIGWSSGQTTPDLQNIASGNYLFQLTDSLGCIHDGNVTVGSTSYTPVLNIGNDTAICNPDSIVLDAGSGFVLYEWSGTPGVQTLVAGLSGSYQVTVTDSNNCSAADTMNLTVNGPDAAFTSSINNLQVQFNDASASAISWSWDFGDGQQANQQHPIHTFNAPGIYTVCLNVSDAGGCEDEICNDVNLILSGSGIQTENVIRLYPNPASDHILVDANGIAEGADTWQITDLSGRTILAGVISAQGKSGLEINVRELPSGIYNFQINGISPTKLLIER